MIYFVRAKDSGHVKIGYSATPHSRFSKMRSDSASELEVVVVIEGDLTDETALHKRFAELRERGEWFRDDGSLTAHMDRLIASGAQVPKPPRKRKQPTNGRPSNAQLIALGLSKSYASELVNGKKLPSLGTALKIQSAFGYPVTEWKVEL